MLTSLKIQNIALVAEADLAFDKGLTVLTGETGAGKSVIVTALSLALGDRADREFLRHGAAKGVVEAQFQISNMSNQYKRDFADYIIDNTITVVREITKDGNSRIRINGTPSSLARLKELTTPMAEILGQHANQMLMNEENHLLFLDHFGGLDTLRELVGQLFAEWERTVKEFKRVVERREQTRKEHELLAYQKAEIEKAQVRMGEEEDLLRERKILDSSRTLMASAELVQNILDNEEQSVIHQLRAARKELDKMADIDNRLNHSADELGDIDFRLEELRRVIEQYGASIPDDPSRLDEINARLDELYNLKKKYGGSEEAILAMLADIKAQLGEYPDVDSMILALERTVERNFKEYSRKAQELSDLRKKASEYLCKLVLRELSELAIDKAGFEAEFMYEEETDGVLLDGKAVKPYAYGLEHARFLFSANPGEPLKSLVKTASGGEMSRILLALKAAEKKNARLRHSLLVFDEVDAGIGGRTAHEVGLKLKRLSETSQVMVVTHLHQIARLADHHYIAEKTRTPGSRATIRVSKLEGASIKEELDRMVALPE
ncbi:MAG: DNA repair protein RecN [Candidatus Zixiibacteriota bacterium]